MAHESASAQRREQIAKAEQANDVAMVVIQQMAAHLPDSFANLTLRYGIADTLWAKGYRRPSAIDRGEHAITDEEWRDFQGIPDQGYSHRHWVNTRISERLAAQRRELLSDEMTDAAVKAVHRALAPQWMTLYPALGGDQQAYDRFLTDVALAVLSEATTRISQ